MAAALLLASGAARASVTVPSDAFTLEWQAGEKALRARMRDSAMSGAWGALTVTPTYLAGEMHGRPVSLSWDDWFIEGWLGEERVELALTQDVGGFELSGAIAERPVSLRVSSFEVSGLLDQCQYALTASAENYEGWIDCMIGDIPRPAHLRLPTRMADLGVGPIAAILVTFLSDDPTRRG